MMSHSWVFYSLFAWALAPGSVRSQITPSTPPSVASYKLKVAVDEVVLTFHAADAQGTAINDLKLDELRLLDDGRPPRKVVAFTSLRDVPIRAGILMDSSDSMQQTRSENRSIAVQYARQLLRQDVDQAFVMNFDALAKIAQPWTNIAAALTGGIRNRNVSQIGEVRVRGTAIFDAIYKACLNQFGHNDNANSGNFILLFSDGEDNSSHDSLQQAVDMCQHTNTAIYAFRTDSASDFGSTGPKVLGELTSQTGGLVFHDTGSEADVSSDLRTIEANLRNQYRLVYRPAELKHDGAFHRIVLKAPERVDSIAVRSGYYAPIR